MEKQYILKVTPFYEIFPVEVSSALDFLESNLGRPFNTESYSGSKSGDLFHAMCWECLPSFNFPKNNFPCLISAHRSVFGDVYCCKVVVSFQEKLFLGYTGDEAERVLDWIISHQHPVWIRKKEV